MVCLQNGQSIILLPQPSHVWWPQLKASRRGASRHTAHRRESALACRWDSAMLRCSTTCRTALVHASSLPASIGNKDLRQQHDHQRHTTQPCCTTYAQQYGLGYTLYKYVIVKQYKTLHNAFFHVQYRTLVSKISYQLPSLSQRNIAPFNLCIQPAAPGSRAGCH